MSIIPDEKVNEVRERASIVEVVADYVSLRKSGANYQGLCPFHGEKTPSFNVNPAQRDLPLFRLRRWRQCTNLYHEDRRALLSRSGQVPRQAGRRRHRRTAADRAGKATLRMSGNALYAINESAADFYRRVLMKDAAGEPGRRYLERRGVDEATAEAYRLGFAPDRWDALTRHLEAKKIPLASAETLGLVRRKEGGGYYDTLQKPPALHHFRCSGASYRFWRKGAR